MEFEGFNSLDYGCKKGKVSSISKKIRVIDGQNYFTANIIIDKQGYNVMKGMKGNADILITEKSILNILMNKLIGNA
jgi:hypothetical protein